MFIHHLSTIFTSILLNLIGEPAPLTDVASLITFEMIHYVIKQFVEHAYFLEVRTRRTLFQFEFKILRAVFPLVVLLETVGERVIWCWIVENSLSPNLICIFSLGHYILSFALFFQSIYLCLQLNYRFLFLLDFLAHFILEWLILLSEMTAILHCLFVALSHLQKFLCSFVVRELYLS